MSAPNQTRELLREWKAARTLRECINERDATPDGTEGSKAITAFMESAKGIMEAVMVQRNDCFSIVDLAALMEFAISVADDEVSESPADCLPLVRKAWRALKALRDAPIAQQEAEGPTLNERRREASDALRHIEYGMQELLALLRLLTARAKEIDTAATGMEGAEHDREYELRNDVLSVLEQTCDKASKVDETALGCIRDAMRCLQ